jgi:hypothetical protein
VRLNSRYIHTYSLYIYAFDVFFFIFCVVLRFICDTHKGVIEREDHQSKTISFAWKISGSHFFFPQMLKYLFQFYSLP